MGQGVASDDDDGDGMGGNAAFIPPLLIDGALTPRARRVSGFGSRVDVEE